MIINRHVPKLKILVLWFWYGVDFEVLDLPRYKYFGILPGGLNTGSARTEAIFFWRHVGISGSADVDDDDRIVITIRTKQLIGAFILSHVIYKRKTEKKNSI